MVTKKVCDICKTDAVRIDKWDSYACKNCNRWLEKACSDEKCEFCSQRPDTPE